MLPAASFDLEICHPERGEKRPELAAEDLLLLGIRPPLPETTPIRSVSKTAKMRFAHTRTSILFYVITIRPSSIRDGDAVWKVLEPTIRAGETYTLPRDFTREQALAYWYAPHHETFVAEENGEILGSYYLRANQQGGGSHVANCGYMTAPWAAGRGIASAMCMHSLDRARERGFRAMQFNIVISTNEVAIRLWQKFGFEIVGQLPGAFHHPAQGYVDAYVMYRHLDS